MLEAVKCDAGLGGMQRGREMEISKMCHDNPVRSDLVHAIDPRKMPVIAFLNFGFALLV